MKKTKKVLLIILASIIGIIVVGFGSFLIYAGNPSEPLDDMYEAIESLDLSNVDIEDENDHISYTVSDPIKNIVFIPGGKVEAESYEYIAASLAVEGYNVTIVKPAFSLAILNPNQGSKFLSDELDNVVIGHSLGGTVASMFSSGDDRVTDMVFLASYPYQDVSDKNVLIITGENDLVLDFADVEASVDYLPSTTIYEEIIGGNHAQFGWYGLQNGDGDASITTINQQYQVITLILDFI